MSVALKNLGAITLFVEDLQRSRTFYQEVFGLEVVFEDESSAAFNFGNTIINLLDVTAARDLIEPATIASPTGGSRVQFTIWVDDVDAVCEAIELHGVALLNGPTDRDWGKRTASFLDPDGNIWEIAKDLPTAEVS